MVKIGKKLTGIITILKDFSMSRFNLLKMVLKNTAVRLAELNVTKESKILQTFMNYKVLKKLVKKKPENTIENIDSTDAK